MSDLDEGSPLVARSKSTPFTYYCRFRNELLNQIDNIFVRPHCENDHGPRFEALDGIRACAFLWVVMYHSLWFSNDWSVTWTKPFRHLSAMGWCGVSMFLALSGFLMSLVLEHVLKKSSGTGIRGHLLALASWFTFRFARIWPVYAAAVFISQVIVARIERRTWWSGCDSLFTHKDKIKFWWRLLDLKQNLLTRIEMGEGCFAATFWTIALECQFYAILPLFSIMRLKSKSFTALTVLITIVFLIWYRYQEAYDRAILLMQYFPDRISALRTFVKPGRTSIELYYRTGFRACEFFMGVLAYHAYDAIICQKANRRQAVLILSEIVFLCGIVSFGIVQYMLNIALRDNDWLAQHPVHEAISLTVPGPLVAFTTAAIIPSLTIGGSDSSFCIQVLRKLLSSLILYPVASLSYTGYLMAGVGLAATFFKPLPKLWSGSPLEVFVVFLFITTSIGAVLSLLVERPCIAIARVFLNKDKKGSKVASLETLTFNYKKETRAITIIFLIILCGSISLSVCIFPALRPLWISYSWRSIERTIPESFTNSSLCTNNSRKVRFSNPKSELLAVDLEGKSALIPYVAPDYDPTRIVILQHGSDSEDWFDETQSLQSLVNQQDFVLAEFSNATRFDPSEVARVISELQHLFPSTSKELTFGIGWGNGASQAIKYACDERTAFAGVWVTNPAHVAAECDNTSPPVDIIFSSSADNVKEVNDLAEAWIMSRQCEPFELVTNLSSTFYACVPDVTLMQSECEPLGKVSLISEEVSTKLILDALFRGGFSDTSATILSRK